MNFDALRRYERPTSAGNSLYSFSQARTEYKTFCENGTISDPKLQQCLEYLTSNSLTLNVTGPSIFPWTDNNNSCVETERYYMEILGMPPKDIKPNREGIMLISEGEPYAVLKRSGKENLLALQTVVNSFGRRSLLKGCLYRPDPQFILAMERKHPHRKDYSDWIIEDTSAYVQSVHFDRFLTPAGIDFAHRNGLQGDLSDILAKMDEEVARVRELL